MKYLLRTGDTRYVQTVETIYSIRLPVYNTRKKPVRSRLSITSRHTCTPGTLCHPGNNFYHPGISTQPDVILNVAGKREHTMLKGTIKNQLPITQHMISKFVSGLDVNELYFGLSLLDDRVSDYRNTFREYENNVFDSMSLMIKLDRSRDQCIPVIPRHNLSELKGQPLPDTVHYVADDTQVSQYTLYKILSGHGNIINQAIPGTSDDGIEFQLIGTYTHQQVVSNWSKLYCTVPVEYGIKNGITEYIFYSLPYPEDEIPVLSNSVSLIYNPKELSSGTICKQDYYWYSHRVKFTAGTQKTGSFFVVGEPDISGSIRQYTPDGYGLIKSSSAHLIKINQGTRLEFNQERYTIESVLKSPVERVSGYTLFTQKFKELYCNSGIKLVVSLEM